MRWMRPRRSARRCGRKEQAPSSRVQSVFANWREVADQLGDPFEREKIPLSKLRQMRRDPMLGFGLSFIKTPHVRAKWYINAVCNAGPNLRWPPTSTRICAGSTPASSLQICNSLDFGFQAIAKRFEFRIPPGTFVDVNPDSGEQEEKPIWSEGGIEPIAWKPFVALRPEGVEPVWERARASSTASSTRLTVETRAVEPPAEALLGEGGRRHEQGGGLQDRPGSLALGDQRERPELRLDLRLSARWATPTATGGATGSAGPSPTAPSSARPTPASSSTTRRASS